MARFDPTRSDFSPYGFSCVRWTPTLMPRCDRHNEIEFNMLESGRLVYLMGGGKVTVPAGRLAVFWAGVPHQIIEFEDLDEYFVLTIPLVRFLQWRLPHHFTHPVLHGKMIIEPDAGLLSSDSARFGAWCEDVQSGSEERCYVSLLEVEARLRRLALCAAADLLSGSSSRSSAVLEEGHLSRADEMACLVAREYTEPLTASVVAQHVGLHPNYAMAVFKRAFGTTLGRYITEHRLSHAQRLLVTTSDPVVTIAFQSGFGSLSRFNDAFRQVCGCTPREYRRLHRLA
jgi:AraC-like DNA-binding protein